MKLLIVYGTTEGQTRKIAEYLKSEAEKAGAEVTLCDASIEQVRPERFKAVMICASMHSEKYQTTVIHYIKSNLAALNDMPSAFVSVSLSAIAEDYDPVSYNEMKSLTADFLTETGWKPVAIEYAAGAIRYTQYDFFKKFTLRQLTKRVGGNNDTSVNHEYTNWTRLSKFLTTFLNMAKAWPTLAEEIL
jgi:menaquinone-dependent protoporphyrinogen oxidase